MLVKRYDEVTPTTYDEGRSGVTMREMITGADGAPAFAMRVFDLAPGAATPYHHPNPLTIAEFGRRWQQGMADLERQDKTLFDAVRQCNWDDMVAEEGITMEEWRKKALKSAARVGRIRAELRESGSI